MLNFENEKLCKHLHSRAENFGDQFTKELGLQRFTKESGLQRGVGRFEVAVRSDGNRSGDVVSINF